LLKVSNLLDYLVLNGIGRVLITTIQAEQHLVQHQNAFPGEGSLVLEVTFCPKILPLYDLANKTRHYSYTVN